jgi:beta-lactam-binding protein with PASTA domain
MSIKEFYTKLRSHYLTSHLLAMALTVILLCVAAGFGLDIYTHHGENITIPNLKGMTYEKAYNLMQDEGLIIQVNDSGYNKQLPANTILAQTPGAGMKVKEGHIIYVTVNSPSSPTFAIPDIVDNSSVREAEARLTAMGFKLTPPMEVEGEKDWVYGIVCRGRRVSNGDRIAIDAPLTLLVGKGTQDNIDELGFVDEFGTQQESDVDEFVEVKEPPTAPQ